MEDHENCNKIDSSQSLGCKGLTRGDPGRCFCLVMLWMLRNLIISRRLPETRRTVLEETVSPQGVPLVKGKLVLAASSIFNG